MAIKVKKEFQDLIALISNIFETYTTALYIYDEPNNTLILKHSYSLNENIKNNFKIKIDKKLKFWIKDFKKPIPIKEEENIYKIFLNIYKKKENIKLIYAVPLENFKGVLYIDTKKMYALPEKHQKLLFHCSKIISHMLNIENAAKDIKATLTYFDFAKKLRFDINKLINENVEMDYFIQHLADILNFEFGCLIKNNFDGTFKIISTNYNNLKELIGKNLFLENNVIGGLLNKNIRHYNFVENFNKNLNFFCKSEKIKKGAIVNYLYYPFIAGRNIFSAFIFFNFKKNLDFAKFYTFCYDMFYSVVYEQVAKEHLEFIIKVEPISGFLREVYFYELIKNNNFKNQGLIYIKNKKFSQILNRYHIDLLLKSYKLLKRSIDNILEENSLAGFFSLNSIGIIYNSNYYNLNKKVTLIEKSFKNRFFKIDNTEINLDLNIEIYRNIEANKIKILTNSYGV